MLRFNPGIASDVGKLRRLRMSRFSRLAALTYPRVGPAELALVCNWITWLFIHDDCWCDDTDVDEVELEQMHGRMIGVLRGEVPRAGDDPLLRMLADLRARMLHWADDAWLARFTADVDHYLQSNRWEANNRRLGVTPPQSVYVKMRRYTGAMDTVFDCIELTEHLHLSQEVREHATISRLSLMANNCVCWANDLFSVDKELLERNAHNLVFVLRHEHKLTLDEAVEQARAMHDDELRSFEWFAARMPTFGEEMDAAIRIYVAGLRSWMRGNVAWAHETPRYKGCLSMRGCGLNV